MRRRSTSQKSRKNRAALIIFVLAALLIAFSMAAVSNMRGIVNELAAANATDVIMITVNDIVREKMQSGALDYERLITLERDSGGSIAAIVTNMAAINTLQADITSAIVEKFGESDITNVSVPLGNLLNDTLLSGTGPRLNFNVLSVTNVTTDFRNEFFSAGINQTRHQIVMDVHVGLSVLFAGERVTDDVTVSVNVAETIIIGDVPNTYADLE